MRGDDDDPYSNGYFQLQVSLLFYRGNIWADSTQDNNPITKGAMETLVITKSKDFSFN